MLADVAGHANRPVKYYQLPCGWKQVCQSSRRHLLLCVVTVVTPKLKTLVQIVNSVCSRHVPVNAQVGLQYGYQPL
jgi:hypothetical protein